MTLLIVYYDLGLGGIQRKIVDIVNFLQKHKPEVNVVLVLRRKERGFSLLPQIKHRNFRLVYLSGQMRTWQPFLLAPFIVFQVWQHCPKAILAFSNLPAICAILAKILLFWRRINVVISEDPSLLPSKQIQLYPLSFLRKGLVMFFYRFTDVIFTVNTSFHADLVTNFHLPKRKVRLIKVWTTIGGQAGKHTGRKVFDLIYVGRLAPVKNVGFLLEGLVALKRRGAHAKLCLVGSGEEEAKLRSLTRERGLEKNVFFAGTQSNVERFLRQGKVFVLASVGEGLPRAALEAMALGLPVLSSRYPGVTDLVDDGQTGMIYDGLADFVGKARRLLADRKLRHMLGRKAQWVVRQNHTARNIYDYLNALGITNEKEI